MHRPAVAGRQRGRVAASMRSGATVLSCGVLPERGRRQGILLVVQRSISRMKNAQERPSGDRVAVPLGSGCRTAIGSPRGL